MNVSLLHLVQRVFCMSARNSWSCWRPCWTCCFPVLCLSTNVSRLFLLPHKERRLEAAHVSPWQPDVRPSSSFLVTCWRSSRWAPDLRKLNEDGELWLVNQGLKGTIRWFPLPQHDSGARGGALLARSSTPPPVFSVCPGGQRGGAGAAVSSSRVFPRWRVGSGSPHSR